MIVNERLWKGVLLIIAVRPLQALVSLLCLNAQRSDRARFKAADADRFVRFLAVAVGASIDSAKRRIDLRDEPPFAGACSQFDCPFRLERRAVSEIGFHQALFF